ncbi:hypothetical protein N9B80_02080 [Methylophilaceae bacterium]|nr:hypothetical protein [Methylophilaceae bacterium]
MRIIFLFALSFFYPTFAHAYLDPGTGSIILQGLIALIGGIAFYFKQIKLIILNLFKKIKQR